VRAILERSATTSAFAVRGGIRTAKSLFQKVIIP
jgi:hypothetical protein